jgi:hypothetical protein
LGLFRHRHREDGTALPSSGLAARFAVWQKEDDHLAQLEEQARTFRGITEAEMPQHVSVALKPGERAYVVVNGAALIEPRSAGGHWEGASHGVSVRVPGTKSMRYRIGATRGHYVRDAERPTPIDTGTAVATDHRLVFAGAKAAREWLWDKAIGIDHHPDAAWTTIAVSNRQKVSGIAYDDATAGDIRFRIDLAFAVGTGHADEFVSEMQAERAEHALQRPGQALPPPAPPATATTPSAPATTPTPSSP